MEANTIWMMFAYQTPELVNSHTGISASMSERVVRPRSGERLRGLVTPLKSRHRSRS